MKFLFHPKIIFSSRLLLGTIFIVSAFLKLYPIEYFELNIAETGFFNWGQTSVIARLIIGSEILIGLFIVFRIYIKFTSLLSIAVLTGFSIYLIYLIFLRPGTEDCGCMGLAVSMTPLQSLLKNIVLIFLSLVIYLFHKSEFLLKGRTILNRIFSFSVLIVAMVLPFVVYPLGSYQLKPSGISKINLGTYTFMKENSNEKIKIQDGKKIICFFTVGCKFCKLASRKLHTYIEKNKAPFPLYLAFFGDTSIIREVYKFQHETRLTNIPFIIMRADSFFQAGGNALPAVYSVSNDSVIRKANFLSLNEGDILQFFK